MTILSDSERGSNSATMPVVHSRIEKLRKEQAKINARQKRRDEQHKQDRRRWCEIEREIHKLELLALVGKPDAIKLAHRRHPGDHCHHLNDKLGTLLAIRRTRCSVDFGPGDDNWTFPVDYIMPVDGMQGFIL